MRACLKGPTVRGHLVTERGWIVPIGGGWEVIPLEKSPTSWRRGAQRLQVVDTLIVQAQGSTWVPLYHEDPSLDGVFGGDTGRSCREGAITSLLDPL